MNFLATLMGNWRLIGLGLMLAFVAGMFAYIEVLKLQKSELVTENKSIKFQLQTSQSNVKKLSEDILHQNLEVDKLKDEGERRLALAAEDLKKAQVQSAGYKKKADDLIKRQPPAGVPLCQAADDLFNEAIKQNANP